jgi:uncharacterized membrane protein YbhN (UPF0104 family)
MAPAAKHKIISVLGTLVGLGMLALAVWIFDRTLAKYEIAEVIRRLGDIPAYKLGLAAGCAALSYLTQALYDWLALLSLGRGASLPRSLFAGSVSNAMVNNMGFSWLTATSLRYRFYSAWGFTTVQIAQTVALTKIAFFNGLLAMAGLTQLLSPVELPGRIGDLLAPRALGFLMLLVPSGFLLWNALAKSGYIHLGKLRLVRPTQAILLLQTAVSALHLVFAGFTLYLLIPMEALRAAHLSGALAFLSVFMALKFVVLFFPIPGGLGVLEGTAVALLTPAIPDYPLLGALLAYRIIYYLAPFALALLSLMVYELDFRSGLAAGLRKRVSGSHRAQAA